MFSPFHPLHLATEFVVHLPSIATSPLHEFHSIQFSSIIHVCPAPLYTLFSSSVLPFNSYTALFSVSPVQLFSAAPLPALYGSVLFSVPFGHIKQSFSPRAHFTLCRSNSRTAARPFPMQRLHCWLDQLSLRRSSRRPAKSSSRSVRSGGGSRRVASQSVAPSCRLNAVNAEPISSTTTQPPKQQLQQQQQYFHCSRDELDLCRGRQPFSGSFIPLLHLLHSIAIRAARNPIFLKLEVENISHPKRNRNDFVLKILKFQTLIKKKQRNRNLARP